MRARIVAVVPLLFAAPGSLSDAPGAAPARYAAATYAHARAEQVKVTILSTMLAGDPGRGIGEWGFAALLEVDGRRLLIDTGARPGTVLQNARELGIDLSTVEELVLTHNHGDHVNGLVALRESLSARNPRALAVAHVAPEIFFRRPTEDGADGNGLAPHRAAYERLGGRFVMHDRAAELFPGVWFTGPVPRVHPERNYGRLGKVETPQGVVDDIVPDDASIVIHTAQGLVVITGCGHAGVVNIVTRAQGMIPGVEVHAIVGGLHLLSASDEQLAWTGRELKARGLDYLLGVHCTGIEATHQLRAALGLTRRSVATGSVGASFTLGAGIDPLLLAR